MVADGIRVHVTGAGPTRKYVAEGDVEVSRGSTLADLLMHYDIPSGMRLVCLVGGTRRPPATELKEGDTVAIVSLLAGG